MAAPTEWPDGAKVLVQGKNGVWIFGTFSDAVPDPESGGWVGNANVKPGTWLNEGRVAEGAIEDDSWKDNILYREHNVPTVGDGSMIDGTAPDNLDFYVTSKKFIVVTPKGTEEVGEIIGRHGEHVWIAFDSDGRKESYHQGDVSLTEFEEDPAMDLFLVMNPEASFHDWMDGDADMQERYKRAIRSGYYKAE